MTASRMRTEQIVGCPLSFSAKVFPPFPALPLTAIVPAHTPLRLPAMLFVVLLFWWILLSSMNSQSAHTHCARYMGCRYGYGNGRREIGMAFFFVLMRLPWTFDFVGVNCIGGYGLTVMVTAASESSGNPPMPDDFFENIEEYLEQSGNDVDYDRESEDDMEEDEGEDMEYRYGSQEDGMIAMETSGAGQIQHKQITDILRPFSKHLDEQHSRVSFRSFLPEAGALATYRPMLSSSPLMNPVTAKIFCHFVYVLGPSMSLFERYPPNPHIAFTPGAGLHGPQNIWSYTIPMLSLSHPPLLHAILALSSLHISKLTKGADHPSLLHYHIALRRLGKALASDRHRGNVATLAATLMLAYYETMAAEHDKWSSHIHGAKQLLKEIDFDRVARRVEMVDDEQAGTVAEQQHQQVSGVSLLHQRRMRRQMIADDGVDDNFKSFLMGSKARRQQQQNKAKRGQADRPFSKKELETLRLQADLFWWYTKMDCFQSLLSGCPLVYVSVPMGSRGLGCFFC